eukprot:GILJ01006026.1.p1 GENE.GILJ01006026.1~~GILJ01006026.1.p1  ORF type:complete len:198 (-),score=19.64 GILJ01006026.1:60-608(-)
MERPSRPVQPVTKEISRLKIVVMGEGGVGKTSVLRRFVEDQFHSKYIATIGADFFVKSMDVHGVEYKVSFWDLAGHPEFFEVRNEFYKETQGALLMFDICSRKSFEALDVWLREANKFGAREMAVVVCGNKMDSSRSRMVSATEAQQWAEARAFHYFEVSAANGEGLEMMFESLVERAVTYI